MRTKDSRWSIAHGFTAQNITLMVFAVLTGAAGFLVNGLQDAAAQAARITALENEVAGLKRRMDGADTRFDGRYNFMACAVRRLDQLQRDSGHPAPCQLELPQ